MGACFNYRVYEDRLGRESITAQWNHSVESSLYDHGHSYSGDIGMLEGDITWLDVNVPTREKALTILHDRHEKWSPALAVSWTQCDENPPIKRWLIGGWCAS